MKKLKLGFTDTHDHLAAFFNHVLGMRYEVELDNDNPEFLIFGDRNFGNDNLNFDRKKVTKIFYTGENQRPDSYACDYAITFDHNYSPWHYRLPLFVIYMWALKHIHKTEYDKNSILKPKIKEKTDFCSFVVKNGKPPEKKGDFLSTRKFNLCFESYSHPGYATEKILHAFLAGTVPIYWGSPTIEADFNQRAFINVHNFKDFEDAIEFIKRVDNDDNIYNFVVNQPKFTQGVLPDYMLYNNFLNWFDAVVYNKIHKRK
jgi:hypothetical protein